MRSLLWKEWHEQSWKLAFSCILLGAMTAIGLHARIISDSDMMIWVCLIGLLLPISYCSGLLPAERADGYFESLIAIPVKPRKILLAKTALGVAMCVIPMLISMGIALVLAGSREATDDEIAALFGRSIVAAIALFMWIFAVTSQLPGETRATLVGLAVWFGLAIISMGLQTWESERIAAVFTPLYLAIEPYEHFSATPTILGITFQGGLAVLFWFWTSHRFTTTAKELA